MSGLLEDDLERGSALIAAVVVTFITITFFSIMIAMLSFTLSVYGDYQVMSYQNTYFYTFVHSL